MTWLETYAKTHLFYIILIAGGVFGFKMWLLEHDARVQADQKIVILNSQIANVNQQAAQQVKVVTKVVHDAVTPSQVVAAIPSVTSLPLATRAIPGNPVDVVVAAQPLMQLAGDDKSARIELQACQQVSALKDEQIVALKKKPKFLNRVAGVMKAVGVGVGIGLLIGGHL